MADLAVGHIADERGEFTADLAERARNARDQHDTIVKQHKGVMMKFQALWMRLPASRDKMALGDIIHDAEACAIEARSSLWELRSNSAERDFATSLRETARKLTRGKQIELSVDIGEVERHFSRASWSISFSGLRVRRSRTPCDTPVPVCCG